jgi:multiple antibiotic resistance protein
VPPAFPLLAGPGAITSFIICYETSGLIATILSIEINSIYMLVGRRGSMIGTRISAVFIEAIAVQYVAEGAKRLPI